MTAPEQTAILTFSEIGRNKIGTKSEKERFLTLQATGTCV